MLYFTLPPTPWPDLDGPFGAALQPHIRGKSALQPHIKGKSALQPHIKGRSALQPHIKGTSDDEADAAQHEALVYGFGWPWFGADTDASLYGPAAMQAYALDKVRSRIMRPEDPRVTATRKKGAQRNALARRGVGLLPRTDDLWRWQGPFRIKAVVAELSARLRVQGTDLHWLGEVDATGALQSYRVFSLVPPDGGFNYASQVDKVLRAAVERQDRLPEILSQADEIAPFFDAITGIDRANAPRLAEMLDTAWEVTTLVVMAMKNDIAELRPFQRNDSVHPIIPTPGHGSLPSGHATMATVASQLLAALRYANDPERCDQLDLLVRRIAFNRVVAGLHFPMDSYAGYALGRHLAATLVAAAEGKALPNDELVIVRMDATLHENEPRPAAPATDAARTIPPLDSWSRLWEAAAAELRLLRV